VGSRKQTRTSTDGEGVPPEVARAIRCYAGATDEALSGITDPRARTVAALVSAGFLLAAAIAEASTLLSSEVIDHTVTFSADMSMRKLSTGAIKIMGDEDLARTMAVLKVAIASGMSEMVIGATEIIQQMNQKEN
jgi:acetylornithine/succinyldiaminopimelate/putrescine aminotransferase